MTGCSAPNCSNRSTNKHMFRFPKKLSRRIIWKTQCRGGRFWELRENSRLCEDHFEESSFQIKPETGKRTLRRDAIPTIFQGSVSPPKRNKISQDSEQCHEQNPSNFIHDHLYFTTTDLQQQGVVVTDINAISGTALPVYSEEQQRELETCKSRHPMTSKMVELCDKCYSSIVKIAEPLPKSIFNHGTVSSLAVEHSYNEDMLSEDNDGDEILFNSDDDEMSFEGNGERYQNLNLELSRRAVVHRLEPLSRSCLSGCADSLSEGNILPSNSKQPIIERINRDSTSVKKENVCFLESEKVARPSKFLSCDAFTQTFESWLVGASFGSKRNGFDVKEHGDKSASESATAEQPPLKEGNCETGPDLETNLRREKQKYWRLEKKYWKLEKKHLSLRRENERLKDSLSFLNEDQFQKLSSKKAMKWSEETLRRAFQLWFSCGKDGYAVLLEFGFPFPSYRTLYRHLQNVTSNSSMIPDLVKLLQENPEEFSETEMQLEEEEVEEEEEEEKLP